MAVQVNDCCNGLEDVVDVEEGWRRRVVVGGD